MLAVVVEVALAGIIAFVVGWAIHRSSVKQQGVLDELILQESSEIDLFAFVAMEYHHLIMNRSYVIFSAPEGLYGWKFMDSVDASNPMFFAPFAGRLAISGTRKASVARKLAANPGGFVIQRGDIAEITFLNKTRWGMAGIPHSGIVRVVLASGGKRDFIVLGGVDGEVVRAQLSF